MNRKTKFVVVSLVAPLLFGLLAYAVLRSASNVAIHQAMDPNKTTSSAASTHASPQLTDAARQAADAQRAQLEATAAQARSDMAAARIDQEIAARKDAAWQAFFKPQKVCDNPPDSETQVECGNAYMRAKREFEERWARGAFH